MEVDDRQLDALLARLDGIQAELHTLNRRLDERDPMLLIARELAALSESLQTLAYAALGQNAPQVRRRRAS